MLHDAAIYKHRQLPMLSILFSHSSSSHVCCDACVQECVWLNSSRLAIHADACTRKTCCIASNCCQLFYWCMIAVYNVMQCCCSLITGHNSNSRLSNGCDLGCTFCPSRRACSAVCAQYAHAAAFSRNLSCWVVLSVANKLLCNCIWL